MSENNKERIVLAAIRYKLDPSPEILSLSYVLKNTPGFVVFIACRHQMCRDYYHLATGLKEEGEDGFLTSHDRFVCRSEALVISLNCEQFKGEVKYDELFSRDLY